MAEITNAGIVATTLAEYTTELQRIWLAAYPELDFAAETRETQLVGLLALLLSQQDEALVSFANALNPITAAGAQLDHLFSLLNIHRRQEARSTIADVEFRGTPRADIPAGTRAATVSGEEFTTTVAATLNDAGVGLIDMQSVSFGPIEAGVGTLTSVIDRVPGWDQVSNANAAALGRLREEDADYRRRFFRVVATNSSGSREAIVARLNDLAFVTRARIIENPSSGALVEGGVTTVAFAITPVVQAPDSTANRESIAAALRESVPIGVLTDGNVAVQTGGDAESGPAIEYRFRFAVETPMAVRVSINLRPGFPATGLAGIRTAVVEYIRALGIGVAPVVGDMTAVIYGVVGGTAIQTADPTATKINGGASVFGGVNADEVLTITTEQVTFDR